jgi:hypothetical protein
MNGVILAQPARAMATLPAPARIQERRAAQITLFDARREALLEKRGVLIKAFLEPAKGSGSACGGFFSHHFNRAKYARSQ